MPHLRVLLDPTVFVAAALSPESPSGRLVRRFLEQRDFEAVASEAILGDIEQALHDLSVRQRLEAGALDVHRWVSAFGVLATVVEPSVPGRDSGDGVALQGTGVAHSFAALAVVGGGVLVTLDRDALECAPPPQVEVVRPEVLLAVLMARA